MSSSDTERLTWVGHATVLLEVGGARLLTDPLLRSRLAHLRRHSAGPAPEVSERIDAVLISHLHFDHLDLASLKRLGRRVRVLVPRGAGRFLGRLGFTRVEELAVGDTATVAGARVRAVQAIHSGRRRPLGTVADTLGFEISGAHHVYFAGDTDFYDGMRSLAGRLDVALLPVWGWGPSLGPGHMDPEAAAQAVALLRPRVAVPIHWGTFFPVGLARWRGEALIDPPHEFARHVAALAPDVDVRVLAPGGGLEL